MEAGCAHRRSGQNANDCAAFFQLVQVFTVCSNRNGRYSSKRQKAQLIVIFTELLSGKMVLPDRIELSTSPLPMECSTTELRQHALGTVTLDQRIGRKGSTERAILATRPGSTQAWESIVRQPKPVVRLAGNAGRRNRLAGALIGRDSANTMGGTVTSAHFPKFVLDCDTHRHELRKVWATHKLTDSSTASSI